MRTALSPQRVKQIYNRAARRYDRQHRFLTAHSDQRGRELVVAETVALGDAVLDCGAGTGSTPRCWRRNRWRMAARSRCLI